MSDVVTLSALADHPLTQVAKVNVSAKQLAGVLKAVDKKNVDRSPDIEAFKFYALNQLVGLIQKRFTKNEILPDWAATPVSMYIQELETQHRPLVWYTFLIITREFRHLLNKSILVPPQYSPDFTAFCPKIADNSDNDLINKWLAYAPGDDLEHYCLCMEAGFNTPKCWASSYGGKPWGRIAKALAKYIGGHTSAEMFIDTAYTLAHNGGPIFNKNMFYHNGTASFKKLLDVQRSGQMCEFLWSKQYIKWYGKSTSLSQLESLRLVVEAAKPWLSEIEDHVDWYKVKALGGTENHLEMQAAQDKDHGPKQPKSTIVEGMPVKVTGSIAVYPGEVVQVFTRIKGSQK